MSIMFLCIDDVYAQNIKISGTVTDEEGLPLIGVNVYIKGTTKGTVTDQQGKYSLRNIEPDKVLVFSYIGYLQEEIPIKNRSEIDVILVPDIKTLDEVVVVGYGKVKKEDLTSSISSVTSKDFEDRPLTNSFDALKGKASGVFVSSASGSPGQEPTIRIRGMGSFQAQNDPLIVVDGIPMDRDMGGILLNINPNDIESVSVLKDASAASIYGSRGANGVVIITTKRGKADQSSINFRMYHGFQSPRKTLNLLNAEQSSDLINEITNGARSNEIDSLKSLYNWDWQNKLFDKQAPISNYSLAFSGGSEKITYRLSGSYLNQSGIVPPSQFEQYTMRLNVDNQLTDKINVGANISGSYNYNRGLKNNANAFNGGVVASALAAPPFIPIYDENGNFAQNPFETNADNPIAQAYGRKQEATTGTFMGNVFGTYELLPGLVYRLNLNTTLSYRKDDSWLSTKDTFEGRTEGGEASTGTRKNMSVLMEHTLRYDKLFGKNHKFTGLIGFTQQNWSFETSRVTRNGFPNDLIELLYSSQVVSEASSNLVERAMMSSLGRINYSYAGKYLFTGALRFDGSSRFGSNNKFGFFPSFSAGWILSKEAFFPEMAAISNLKLRAAWGKTGNDLIGDYKYLATYGTGSTYLGGAGQVISYRQSTLQNNDLKWEAIQQYNFGIDLSLYNDRISLSTDYYLKTTVDMLTNMQLPTASGLPPQDYWRRHPVSSVNMDGDGIRNRGFEVTISSHNLIREFKWNTDLNFTRYRNELINIGDESELHIESAYLGYIYRLAKEGEELWALYGLEMNGLYLSQEDVDNGPTIAGSDIGDVRYVDQNDDGIIDEANDRVIIGSPHPDLFVGLVNQFSYKGFDLTIDINVVYGKDIFNGTRRELDAMNSMRNASVKVLDRWQKPGQITNVPRAGEYPNNLLASTRFIEDGSYVRVRDMVIGYTIPEKWMQPLNISRFRVYASLNNFFTFTNYSGYDPEVGDDGIDFNSYPHVKTVSFGLNLDF